jgi:F-type H+-transporting ATPase subunit delta
MKISREARRQSRELFELTLVNGRIDESRLREIFGGVAEKMPRSYLQILKELTRLVRLEVASHHAVIESAIPLDPAQSGLIEKDLRSRFGDITAEFRKNPNLIAGTRVRLGSDVWDGSIQARLEIIKQQL